MISICFIGEKTFFSKKAKHFQDFSFPEYLGRLLNYITFKKLFLGIQIWHSKCEIIVFLKNQIPKNFQIFNFEKLDFKKIWNFYNFKNIKNGISVKNWV